jgi:hypothetical protein
MKPSQLRQLTDVAEARKVRDLAELEALTSEDRRLAEAIEAYARAPAQDLLDSGENVPLAQIALRMEWADRNIAIARRQRAALAGRIAVFRKRAAVSLGKHQALEKLTERSIRRRADLAQAREEKEAAPRDFLGLDPEDPQALD